MGRPVVHFEVWGTDAEKLRAFYGELFDWKMNTDNPMGYGTVNREDNLTSEGVGIGGGIGGHSDSPSRVTFYVAVPDVEEALVKAESLGGTRTLGPTQVTPDTLLGEFTDPEGQTIGLIQDQP